MDYRSICDIYQIPIFWKLSNPTCTQTEQIKQWKTWVSFINARRIYLPCWGPTFPLSKDELAVMSSSLIAPFSIPSGAIHCAADKNKHKGHLTMQSQRFPIKVLTWIDGFHGDGYCQQNIDDCHMEPLHAFLCRPGEGSLQLPTFMTSYLELKYSLLVLKLAFLDLKF